MFNPTIIKELLDESGASYNQNSVSYILTCPRCRKRQKLYIRKKDGIFCCWVCKETDGFRGKPEWVFAELLGQSPKELRTRIYGTSLGTGALYLDVQLRDFYDPEEMDEEPPGAAFFPEVMPDPGFRDLDSAAAAEGRKYLESRGISLEIAKVYDIQYAPADNRVIFPIKSGGRLLGWQARLAGPSEYWDAENGVQVSVPKALTSFGLKKDRLFMFGDRLAGSRHAVLCEGPVDALKAHLCGGNVASMGAAVSATQLQLLRNSGIERLYLALDPDAYRDAQRVVKELCTDMEIYDMRPRLPHKDLGEMSMEAVKELFDAAPRIDRNYLFIYLKDHYGK